MQPAFLILACLLAGAALADTAIVTWTAPADPIKETRVLVSVCDKPTNNVVIVPATANFTSVTYPRDGQVWCAVAYFIGMNGVPGELSNSVSLPFTPLPVPVPQSFAVRP